MVLSTRYPATSLYRVEVSGWDKNEAFFVEKSELEWNEEADKHVVLNHMLRDGSMVFVRLLQPSAGERSYPLAYEAEFIGTKKEGQHQFRLRQVHPLSPEHRTVQ
jgi:hypothetical protein